MLVSHFWHFDSCFLWIPPFFLPYPGGLPLFRFLVRAKFELSGVLVQTTTFWVRKGALALALAAKCQFTINHPRPEPAVGTPGVVVSPPCRVRHSFAEARHPTKVTPRGLLLGIGRFKVRGHALS